MENLAVVLSQVASGDIRIGETFTQTPSPFCGSIVWKQTNAVMYADDTPEAGGAAGPAGAAGGFRARGGTGLRADLVREIALSPGLRPRVPAAGQDVKCGAILIN